MFKKIDYQTFKTVLIPRILNILETSQQIPVKIKVLDCLNSLHDGLDS